MVRDRVAHAERQAVNTACQGSAADLVKYAMVHLEAALEKLLPPEAVRLVLQVGWASPCRAPRLAIISAGVR